MNENLFLITKKYVIKHVFQKTIHIFAALIMEKTRCETCFPMCGKPKKMRIMKKDLNEILMLQYRIKRYQAMRNGTMCQTLNGQLQKLLAKQPQVTV